MKKVFHHNNPNQQRDSTNEAKKLEDSSFSPFKLSMTKSREFSLKSIRNNQQLSNVSSQSQFFDQSFKDSLVIQNRSEMFPLFSTHESKQVQPIDDQLVTPSKEQVEKRDESQLSDLKSFKIPPTTQKCAVSQLPKEETDRLFQNNSNYLKHIQGDCICGKCTCGHCRCPEYLKKLDQHSVAKTIYAQDFIGQTPHPSLKINSDIYSTSKVTAPMDLNSTQRIDYVLHQNNSFANLRIESEPKEPIPFSGVSSYNQSFLYWGTTPSKLLQPPVYATIVPNVQLDSQTTYQNNFQNSLPSINLMFKPKQEFQKRKQKNQNKIQSTISRDQNRNDLPFLSETTNKVFFKPFQLGITFQRANMKHNSSQIPSYEGQFNTEAKSNYNQKGNIKCPSRVMLNELYQTDMIQQKDEREALNE